MESLLLFRKGSSSPTMCRLIPALSDHKPPNKAGGQSVNLSTTFASWLRGRSKQPILNAEVIRCEATVIGRIALGTIRVAVLGVMVVAMGVIWYVRH
jgi:hypothetical protein